MSDFVNPIPIARRGGSQPLSDYELRNVTRRKKYRSTCPDGKVKYKTKKGETACRKKAVRRGPSVTRAQLIAEIRAILREKYAPNNPKQKRFPGFELSKWNKEKLLKTLREVSY
jgi:hypothetical protein